MTTIVHRTFSRMWRYLPVGLGRSVTYSEVKPNASLGPPEAMPLFGKKILRVLSKIVPQFIIGFETMGIKILLNS